MEHKEPHSISLKVLRLSKPSLSQQFPLPTDSSTLAIYPKAALSVAADGIDNGFLLSPALTLPPAFGSAYIGETFACTLCANNELLPDSERVVTSIKIGAEMQTPATTFPLDLLPEVDDTSNSPVKPGTSLQKIVRFDLKDEGNHVLVVSISYSETTMSKGEKSASSGRVRSFRKLYQFITQPCLNVRTKVMDFPSLAHDEKGLENVKLDRYGLEAQLENLTDSIVTLTKVTLNAKPPFKSTSLNWDRVWQDRPPLECPKLSPRDVTQIAFLVEQQADDQSSQKEVTKDGRTVLGNLDIYWLTAMGDPGFLSTGWLMTRRR